MNLSGISKFVGSPLGDKHADKEKGEKQMSLASISSMASKTMKLGAGMGAGLTSNLSKMPGNLANLGGSGEVEKKARKAAEKKEQLAKIMTILEDVTLQCPPSHTGLVVAYNDADLSPIMHPGLRFTWFRMSGDANVVQVDESHRGWYAPTVDDIGCVICSQCEDNFDQGLSRYSEVRDSVY
ncbi:hypothetical protein B484DRAFT_292351 [Ochromonadaceae sp. CCMP2298]|nr:hypothetical protein B484DRAFT_292351 [Ochromonadaceae sp. CCMP2298]